MKKRNRIPIAVCSAVLLIAVILLGLTVAVRAAFPRPYRAEVRESGLQEALVYSVMKAESGFDEDAKSKAGAVGLMQLLPATAEFICGLSGIPFEAERLTEGEYNVRLGCAYLLYLFGKFECEETALCAYNAGEGTVSEWLKNPAYSRDGRTLEKIPYAETAEYVKKIGKYQKFYRFFY